MCPVYLVYILFFFNDTATTEIYTLSYTTLFRSLPCILAFSKAFLASSEECSLISCRCLAVSPRCAYRSEEHTSELQSRRDLVCRLLLEKKKKKKSKRKSNHSTDPIST